MPVSEEVMVEGFLQIVSETRLSVKQFCKTLVGQIEETDGTLTDNLNLLLQPYKLSLNSRYSKAVLCHLEAIINQSLYQDFENSVFQKNGSPMHLDPQQDRQAQFASFVALRNLSWNEVLRKGTKYYSEEFSKFCDQKMSCIITTMNWTRPWPEQLLQAFFVAAKCIWLLHLLAFSFSHPLGILRVEENRSFDPHYMEDMFMDRHHMVQPDSSIHLLEIPFDSSGHGLPPDTENTDVLSYPLIIRLFHASTSLEPAFRKLIQDIAHEQGRQPPPCIIADIFFGWTATVAKELGVFHAVFSGAGGYGLACYYSVWLTLPHRNAKSDEFELQDFKEVSKLHVTKLPLSISEADGSDSWSVFQRKNLPAWVDSNGILFNTVKEFDQIGLSYFRRKLRQPLGQ
ncbi:hypothetical protein GH714_027690 [Hevea brasiliensis]|uniref:Uncharacterized protein n=1 Tax=Hevea brasiliensis TaxID=3981 RepID=A0A6A6ME65_HEVBR|nr:hypothetical protein GH714_027690 [Hevea brasiliensis]